MSYTGWGNKLINSLNSLNSLMAKEKGGVMDRKIISVAILLLVVTVGWAGEARAWEINKPADLNYFYIPKTESKEGRGEIEMNSVQATGMVPVGLGETTFLTVGLDCQALFVGYQDIGTWVYNGRTYTKDDLPDDLYALDLVAGLGAEFGDWLAYAEFRPGLHSDLKDIDSRDIYYQGGVFVFYTFSEDFTGSLGLFYGDSFGEPELYPLLGVQWLIGSGFALDALIPSYLLVSYQADDWLKFGLRGRLNGHQFRLRGLIWKDTVLKYEQVLIGPFVDINLTDSLVLRLEGGVATGRKFEFRDDDSSEKLYDGDIKDNGYLSAAISLVY